MSTANVTIKGRHAVDPTLNQIAWRLNTVRWATPLDADEESLAHSVNTDMAAPRRLLAMMPDYKTWAIRMYLGGAQRILGFFKGPDIANGLRFADMVKVYFWKYRHRGPHEPADHELNYSVERAKADLTDELEAIQLIHDIEAHLQEIGALLTPQQAEQLRNEQKASRPLRRTVSNLMVEMNEHWMLRVQGFEQQITKLTAEVARVNTLLEKALTVAQSPLPPPTDLGVS